MKIQVTAEDIACAIRRNSCKCAVAAALIRTGHEDPSIYVPESPKRVGEISYTDRASLTTVTWYMPEDVRKRLHAWDEGEALEPFEFEALGERP